jgi:N6-adenosine-specific RNA methylase IME4
LADWQITRDQSSLFQKVAGHSEALLNEYVATMQENQWEASTIGFLSWAKKQNKQDRASQQAHRAEIAQQLPPALFNVIYADPAWEYSNTGVHGAAEHHYGTMATDDICAMLEQSNVEIADNAVLFMWVTNPLLEDALRVVQAWGFEYKTNIVWVKTDLVKPGSGFYVRGRHELLFICTRGSFTPLVDVSPPIGSVIAAPVQEHSRKPDEVYEIIERLYPGCNYLEMFARRERPGWVAWGDEVERPA